MWRDKPLINRQQRRNRNSQGNGFTSRRQVIQHVPFLLAQGHHGRQNAFNKQAAIFTLRAIATPPPDDTPTQSAFGRIVGRFNPFAIHKGPQRLLDLENIQAGAAGFAVIQQST